MGANPCRVHSGRLVGKADFRAFRCKFRCPPTWIAVVLDTSKAEDDLFEVDPSHHRVLRIDIRISRGLQAGEKLLR